MLGWLVGSLARLEERKTAPVSPVFVRYWCVCVCVCLASRLTHLLSLLYTEDVS